MAEFSYDDTTADADVVSAVVAQMSNAPVNPLSNSERGELDNFIRASRARDEAMRLDYQLKSQAELEAKQAEDNRLAAIARTERTRLLQDELRKQNERHRHERTLTGLLDHAIEQRQFRASYTKSATNAAARKRLSSALDNAIATRYPPPPPEPNVVVVEQDDGSADFGSRNFDVTKWSRKPRSWW